MKDAHPTIWAWRQPTGDYASKIVLVYLAQRSDKSFCCWPNINTIARETYLGYSTVSRALRTLEAKKLINRQADHRKDGSQTASKTYLTFVEAPSHPPIPKKKRKTVKKAKIPCSVLTGGCYPVAGGLLCDSTLELLNGNHSEAEEAFSKKNRNQVMIRAASRFLNQDNNRLLSTCRQ